MVKNIVLKQGEKLCKFKCLHIKTFSKNSETREKNCVNLNAYT